MHGKTAAAMAAICATLTIVYLEDALSAHRVRGAANNQVSTKSGLLAGAAGRNPSIRVFKGIPFAAPPVGPLRWHAPEPPAPWPGVRAAAEFSPSCIQTIVEEKKPWTYEFMAHGAVSEDCLYLNVWTAAPSASEKRPVFVYIYGGGNVEGSGSVPAYDGEGLASKGLVVVTFNYRVGVLGFFSHPELTRESSYHASGNYGLLDQIAAVRWVHENIAAFGGDPNRVTVAGQSAGAGAVHSLTASPLAKGLFQRAIADSGAAGGGTRTMADQDADGVRFAEAKKAHSIAELRAMSWPDVVAPVPGVRFAPLPDGYALPASVRQTFAAGSQNDVPTLTGINADEGGASPHPATTLEAFQQQARQRYGEMADEFLKLYPASTDEQAKLAQNESARDLARSTLHAWALDRAKTARTPAFTYFWTHPLPGPDADQYGAFHTSEVPYVLNTLSRSGRPFTAADHRIADTLSSYWANFAATGDPNGKGLPAWPAVSADAATTMEVGENFGPIPVAGSKEKREFLTRFLARSNAPAPPRTAGQAPGAPGRVRLVAGPQTQFFDDFSGPQLDRTKWTVIVGRPFNNEHQAYVDSSETIAVVSGDAAAGAENGALEVRSRYRRGFTTADGDKFDFISGRLETRGKFDFTYGTAAARVKLTAGAGIWPAFWVLGPGKWPDTGEMDILENVGDPAWTNFAVHGPGYWGATAFAARQHFDGGADTTAWHIYSMDWTKDAMVFRVDGREAYRVTRELVERRGAWAFDSPKFLVVNQALGGDYPYGVNHVEKPYRGLPALTVDLIKADGAVMLVDWVRVTSN